MLSLQQQQEHLTNVIGPSQWTALYFGCWPASIPWISGASHLRRRL